MHGYRGGPGQEGRTRGAIPTHSRSLPNAMPQQAATHKDFILEWPLYSFPRPALTKDTNLVIKNNRNLFSNGLGGQKSKFKVSAGPQCLCGL